MKKLLLIIFFVKIVFASAQENRMHCISPDNDNKQIQIYQQFEKKRGEIKNIIDQNINTTSAQRTGTRQIYVIPVVFHILHNYGPENIPDSNIFRAVDNLTNDFRKWNADTIDIVQSFQSIAADCEIEFRLANIDPNGNCTNGIERIVTTNTYVFQSNQYLHPWPNNEYLNIWVVNTFANTALVAFGTIPGGSPLTDGIMCRYFVVGDTAVYKRELTHAMGHYLNLMHPSGSSNGIVCGDDSIADTPPTKGWDHCDLTGSICNPPVIENVQNFMEYSGCTNMFTQGQAAKMHTTLNSPVSGRNNLWTNANLTATGTDGSPITICSPHADFYANPRNACKGDTIKFQDLSWNAPATGWNWTFPGGIPSGSTIANPMVVYTSAGLYNAKLIVTSAGGTDSITKNFFIHISDTAMKSVPFTEDFEDTTSFPGIDGWVENPDTSPTSLWMRISNANTTTGGSHSIMINNYTDSAGQVDSWISPSIDFTNVGFPIFMKFNVANAQRSSTSDDALKIYYSTDCGKSWHFSSYSKAGATLSTVGIVPSNFVPTSIIQWRNESVNLNAIQHQPNVRFKFENTSDHGNNTYIDDINITGNLTGIDEADELQNSFTIFPNPTNGESTLSFNLPKTNHVSIDVKNILGQIIFSIPDKTIDSGMHENKLPVFMAGIYLVDVVINNKHYIRKLIVT